VQHRLSARVFATTDFIGGDAIGVTQSMQCEYIERNILEVHHMKRIALALVTLVTIAAGCSSTTATLAPTNRNPASEGSVVARDGKNGNTELVVDLNHLPDPGVYGATTYVVWIRPSATDDYLNVGQVAIDKKRHGRLATLTPHEQFDVLVTAEDRATSGEPSQVIMLRGAVDQR
jgi:hypothetical protein